MKIGFDIDGTILSNDNKYNLVRKYFPTFDENIHYTKYPLAESLKLHGFVDTDNDLFYRNNKEVMLGEGTFYKSFIEFYWKLVDLGHEIYFVTAREPSYAELTQKLFGLNGIPYNNVYYIPSMQKVYKLKELEIDVFFEDNVKVIEHILENSDIKMGFIQAPYNKEYNYQHDNLQLYRFWDIVLDEFEY